MGEDIVYWRSSARWAGCDRFGPLSRRGARTFMSRKAGMKRDTGLGECKLAFLEQHHGRHAGDWLAHRRDAEDAVRSSIDRPGLDVLETQHLHVD